MQPKKTQLAGSFRGQVVCYQRDLGPDNATLTDWALDWEWQAPSKDNPVPISTPPYAIIYGIGAFFFYSYAFGLPLFLGTRLYLGRHRLNDLRFGRKFGYLYKRYESGWYAWELAIMARKVTLAVIQVFIKLPNGDPLPIQQSALGMCTLLTALCAQAFAMPYAEYHLDVLDLALLSSSYIFLFSGVCSYMINEQSPSYSVDRELSWLLTAVMVVVLVAAFALIVFMMMLDITLQLVRLYYRFVEGEGKFGAHQQLVLRRLGSEMTRMQQLGVRFVDREKRSQFNTWLNYKATTEQKILLQAAFSSLEYYIEHHKEYSKPFFVTYVRDVPILGKLIGVIWETYVERRTARRKARAARKKAKQEARRRELKSVEEARQSVSANAQLDGPAESQPHNGNVLLRTTSMSVGEDQARAPARSFMPKRFTSMLRRETSNVGEDSPEVAQPRRMSFSRKMADDSNTNAPAPIETDDVVIDEAVRQSSESESPVVHSSADPAMEATGSREPSGNSPNAGQVTHMDAADSDEKEPRVGMTEDPALVRRPPATPPPPCARRVDSAAQSELPQDTGLASAPNQANRERPESSATNCSPSTPSQNSDI